jgi:hypothetical protein
MCKWYGGMQTGTTTTLQARQLRNHRSVLSAASGKASTRRRNLVTMPTSYQSLRIQCEGNETL